MAIDVQKQDLTFPHRADAHGTKGKGPLATAQVRWHEQVTWAGGSWHLGVVQRSTEESVFKKKQTNQFIFLYLPHFDLCNFISSLNDIQLLQEHLYFP